MRTLVIPDVHTQIEKAERILTVPHDQVVWLGDWFDDFDDTLESNRKTAEWLKTRLDTTEDTFLLGNHDAPYMWPGIDDLLCSGFHPLKAMEIRKVLPPALYRERFRFYFSVGGFLISHAGVHPSFWPGSILDLCEAEQQAKTALCCGRMHPLVGAGRSRGGRQPFGGLNWLDWSEFEPIEGISQIVGHTRGTDVRQNGRNWCIDTHLGHYGLIEDGHFSTHAIPAERARSKPAVRQRKPRQAPTKKNRLKKDHAS